MTSSTPISKEILLIDAGVTGYVDCRELQTLIAQQVMAGGCCDALIFTEHTATITLGRTATLLNLLASQETLTNLGVAVIESDRGGDITFHGPGQIVGYPIINLRNDRHSCDIHKYLRQLEEVIILAIHPFGLQAGRVPGLTGVWIDNTHQSTRKIAALGVKVSKWVTQHGFALNVNTDMDFFKLIIPCGISDHGVTSMSSELGMPVSIDDVRASLVKCFQQVFGYDTVNIVHATDLMYDK